MNLAGNIQMLRRKMNLSQEELAEKCQVSRQAVTKWENGESVPTIDKLISLADLYEMTLDELVGRDSFDKYTRIKDYLKEFEAKDIPADADDDFSPIIKRYLLFAERMELSAEDRLRGLEEIFLYDIQKRD